MSALLLCICLYTDLLWKKIYNCITVTAACFGIYFHAVNPVQGHGPGFAISGMLLGTAVLIVPFMLGATGGGDVKLFAALGALLGPRAMVCVFLYTSLAGGVFSFVLLMKKGQLSALKNLRHDVNLLLAEPGSRVCTRKAGYIPWSVPASLGYLVYVLIGGIF